MTLLGRDMVSKLIMLISIIVIYLSLKFIVSQDKWSPIDEYAHMDYIEKLSQGILPKLSDPISEEIFQSIIQDTASSLNPKIKTREELSIASISYEAIHPPIYYSFLVLPNLVLKKMEMPIFERLKILRILSYLFFVFGTYFCIYVFKGISNLGYQIPEFFGYGCFLFGLIFITHQRYGLGNNMLAPFSVNLTAIFLLDYLKKTTQTNLLKFIACACISVFVAISNLFIIPFLILMALIKFFNKFSIKSFIYSCLIIVVFALLFIYWKLITKPDPLINENFQYILNAFIPAGIIDYQTFFYFLTEDAFTIHILYEKLNCTNFLILLFMINTIIGILGIKTTLKKHSWIFAFILIMLWFSVLTFLLNKYVARIHWVAFRHYLGFIPVIYLSCFGFIVVIYSKYFNKTPN
jgi:hypothetical protein